jgi:hypothetical protein
MKPFSPSSKTQSGLKECTKGPDSTNGRRLPHPFESRQRNPFCPCFEVESELTDRIKGYSANSVGHLVHRPAERRAPVACEVDVG